MQLGELQVIIYQDVIRYVVEIEDAGLRDRASNVSPQWLHSIPGNTAGAEVPSRNPSF